MKSNGKKQLLLWNSQRPNISGTILLGRDLIGLLKTLEHYTSKGGITYEDRRAALTLPIRHITLDFSFPMSSEGQTFRSNLLEDVDVRVNAAVYDRLLETIEKLRKEPEKYKRGAHFKFNVPGVHSYTAESAKVGRGQSIAESLLPRVLTRKVWKPSLNGYLGSLLVSEDIKDALVNYDWKQHEPQVRDWQISRESALLKVELKGAIFRDHSHN